MLGLFARYIFPYLKAYPKYLETFQKFNLKIVQNNSGEIRSIRKSKSNIF